MPLQCWSSISVEAVMLSPHVLDVLVRLVQVLDQEPIEGCLWIVEENRIRIRGEPG